jgi:hypothetical protein
VYRTSTLHKLEERRAQEEEGEEGCDGYGLDLRHCSHELAENPRLDNTSSIPNEGADGPQGQGS